MSAEDIKTERDKLEQAIKVQESLRGQLDDSILDATLAALHQQLNTLERPPPTPEQKRKQATVLFMDIAGSTDMIRILDVEDNLDFMDTALKRLAAPVKEHGGRITRYMGDGFMALFGAKRTRENEPEMAVLAGLGILKAAKMYEQEVASCWGISQFKVRVGINTGLVVIGGQTEGEDTLAGTAINLGARMEKAAPPGRLLISHHTYQHVKGIIEVEPREILSLRGFDQPIPTYLVKKAKGRTFWLGNRGVAGVMTRMVGRKQELQLLQSTHLASIQEHTKKMVTVLGEAGMGKSRLMHEFEGWVELRNDNYHHFRGRCEQSLQSTPMFLIRDLLRTRFNILDSDPLPDVWQKITNGFGEVFSEVEPGEMYSHLIGQLIGYDFSQSPHILGIRDDGAQILQRGTAYLTRYFQGLSQQDPILILLEDIHWADDGSLDFVRHLTSELQDGSLNIVASARPEILESRPAWIEGQAAHTHIELNPLTLKESRALAAEVLQKVTDLPEDLQELIAVRAEGNPFYMEELVKMFIEEGVILRKDAHWVVDGQWLTTVKVPATLAGVLQARLDALGTEPRRALQQASVIGRVFWDKLLAAVRSQQLDEHLHRLLQTLRQKEFVGQRKASTFAELQEYVFRHGLMREVVYESVLIRYRRKWHGLVADWLLENETARGQEYTSFLAEQLELAKRIPEAIQYHQLAGEQAYHSGQYEIAKHEFSCSLDLAEIPEIKAELQPAAVPTLSYWLGEVLNKQGDYERALEQYNHARAAAEQVGAAILMAQTLAGIANIAERQGRYELGIKSSLAALEITRLTGDHEISALVLHRLAWVHLRRGTLDEAEPLLIEAEQLALEAEIPRVLANVWNALATLAHFRGQYTASERYREQCLAAARQLGDRNLELVALGNLGDTMRQAGDLSKSQRITSEALEMAREMGNKLSESIQLLNLGHILTAQKEKISAVGCYFDAILLAHQIGSPPIVLEALVGWAEIKADLGETRTALAWLGLVQNHPNLNIDTKQEMEPILMQLKTVLTTKEIKSGLEMGAALSLDEVVDTIGSTHTL